MSLEEPGLPHDVSAVAGSATGLLQLLYKLFGATRLYTGRQPYENGMVGCTQLSDLQPDLFKGRAVTI